MRRRLLTAAGATGVAGAIAAAVALAAGPPVPVTGDASGLTPTGAALAGSVNPNGLPTTAAFDYGTSTAYGSSTPAKSAGDGTAAVDVSTTLTGLKASTTYHYRLSAANSSGTDAGADRTFTTPAAPARPAVSGIAASAVTTSSATVGASVDPQGQQTDVVFDYGTTNAYGLSTPAQSAGAGTAAVTIKATIGGLQPNTTYHYRARATNATGTATAGDRTFRTGALAKPAVTTGAAGGISAGTATIEGKVDPNGRPTTAFVQIGTTKAYGSQTAGVSAGQGGSAVTVKIPVAGLSPLTTYHYRVGAQSDAGTVFGADKTFRTARIPNTLALSVASARIVYGRATTLTAVLGGSGNGGVALDLRAAPYPFTGGYLAVVPAPRTDGAGRATVAVAPRRTTRYVAATTVGGFAVRSRTVRVTVQPSVTATVTRLRGGRVRIRGVIRPRGTGAVTLRRKVGDYGVVVKSVRARPVPGTIFARYTMTLRTKPGIYLVHDKPDSRALAAGDSRSFRLP